MEHMQVLQPVMNKSWVNNRNEKIKIKNLFLHPQKEVCKDFSGYLVLPIDYCHSSKYSHWSS